MQVRRVVVDLRRWPIAEVLPDIKVGRDENGEHRCLDEQEERVAPPDGRAMIDRALRQLRYINDGATRVHDIDSLGVSAAGISSGSSCCFSALSRCCFASSVPLQNHGINAPMQTSPPMRNAQGVKMQPMIVPVTAIPRGSGMMESPTISYLWSGAASRMVVLRTSRMSFRTPMITGEISFCSQSGSRPGTVGR